MHASNNKALNLNASAFNIMSAHVVYTFIVLCVGGSKAPPVTVLRKVCFMTAPCALLTLVHAPRTCSN